MVTDKQKALAESIKKAFEEHGVDLEIGAVGQVLATEYFGICWSIGCEDGCAYGCLSACKSNNANQSN